MAHQGLEDSWCRQCWTGRSWSRITSWSISGIFRELQEGHELTLDHWGLDNS